MQTNPIETEQGIVTIVTPVRPGHLDTLEAVLGRIASQLPPKSQTVAPGPVPFEALETVHYLRWVVLPRALDARGRVIGPELVLTSCFDGRLDAHLHDLVHVAGEALLDVYAHCEGSPPSGAGARDALVAYLRAHVVPPAASYIASRHRSAARIRGEGALHRALERAIDEHLAGHEEPSVHGIATGLYDHVKRTPELRWALEPPARPALGWYVRHWGRLALILAAAVVLLPVLLPVALVVLGILRRAERGEGTSDREPIYSNAPASLDHLQRLEALEDFEVQNELTHVSPLRPGRVRLWTLRAVCFVVQLRADYIDTKGTFGGISSIHFAHWNVIDGGRRLLFCTNYDGTWESYLDEFIDRAASALTAVWSHCIDFPPTRLLMIGGARDEQRFKAWFRRFQVPTTVWYSGYPRLSVQNVQNNTRIRDGLCRATWPGSIEAWLRRF